MAENLAELAETWLTWRDTARPSPATLRARRADLAVIGELIGVGLRRSPLPGEHVPLRRWLSLLSPADLTPDIVIAAFNSYAEHHAVSSLRRCRSTWLYFCTWLSSERGLLDWNPIELVERPRSHRWVPRPLSDDELGRVLIAAQTPSKRAHHPWAELEQVLCALFVGAGLRVSEAIGARVEDVRSSSRGHGVISVVGKGSVIRVVPLAGGVMRILNRYLDSRIERFEHVDSADPLLISARGRRLTPKAVDNLVVGWFRRADVEPPAGALAQSLRHTYTTMMVDPSAANKAIEILLGPGQVTTAHLDAAANIDLRARPRLVGPTSPGG